MEAFRLVVVCSDVLDRFLQSKQLSEMQLDMANCFKFLFKMKRKYVFNDTFIYPFCLNKEVKCSFQSCWKRNSMSIFLLRRNFNSSDILFNTISF